MEMIKTIIVEDEYLVRMGLKMVINWEQYGFQIVGEASDGAEGIKLYQKFNPQLIITDIQMPGINGLEMMKEIRNQDKDVKFIVISAYDQFEYAKQAIEYGVLKYCLKGSLMDTEIIQILEEIRNEFSPHTIESNRYYNDLEEKILKDYFHNLPFLRCFCFSKTNDKMVQKVNDYFTSVDIAYVYTIKHQYVYWVIGCSDNMRLQTLSTRIPLQKDLEFMGVSSEFELCKDYAKYINEAYFANRIHVINEKNINFYEDIPEIYNAGSIIKEVKKISELMSMENYDEAISQLKYIQKSILEIGSVYLFHKVIYKLIGVIAEYNVKIIEKTLYEELIDLDNYNEIFTKLVEYIKQECLENQKISEERKYVKKVKNYIGHHYQENVKIKELADLVHLSPNYLGKIFYMETKEHLSDYINHIRLEKAKSLLKSGIYPVGEIGIMVGIGDPYYFSKIFKKRYGISPKECSKNN